MSLLTEWREHAYSLDDRTPEGKEFWLDYFQREKAIYEKILENPVEIEGGTVKELAEKYDMSIELMIGFLDGIEDSLIVPNKVGRNDPCPCGSGKKYKKCCGANA